MALEKSTIQTFPSFVLALREVIENEYWREFYYEPQKRVKAFEKFESFLDDIGVPKEQLLAILEAQKEHKLLARVRTELGGDLAEHGGDRKSDQVCDTNLKKQTDATYVTARLRRDHPDLHQEVMDGKLSANGAAVKAGIRKRYFNVPADDVDAAVAKLVKEFGEETVRRALGDLVVA
jgi:hypothetical protein